MLNNSHAYPFCKTTPGTISYLDCTIFVSVTCGNWSQNYSVSVTRGAPSNLVFWSCQVNKLAPFNIVYIKQQ